MRFCSFDQSVFYWLIGRIIEDDIQRRRIGSLNSLSSFIYDVKTQLEDKEGLGGKIDTEGWTRISESVKETSHWIDVYGGLASLEDLELKLIGVSLLSFLMNSCIDLAGSLQQKYKVLSTPL